MHTSPPTASSHSIRAATFVAAVVLLGLALGGGWVVSQVRMAPSAVPAEMSVPASKKTKRTLSASTHQTLQRTGSGPAWNTLTNQQKEVLTPLKERWKDMGELTKRRWMSLAEGFEQLPPEGQIKLQERMQTWSSLSAQQRNQARLNFFSSRQLSPEDLQAKWDAYQALSADEKRRLAAKAAPKSRGAATALRPTAKRKLATIPAASNAPQSVANPPKISLPPPQPPLRPVPAVTSPAPPVLTAPVVVPQASTVIQLPPLEASAPQEQVMDSDDSFGHSHPDFPPVHPPQ